MYNPQESDARLDRVSKALVEGLGTIDPRECYGPDGRETVGANMMAAMARAIVSVEAERRAANKMAPQEQAKPVLVPLPTIPRARK